MRPPINYGQDGAATFIHRGAYMTEAGSSSEYSTLELFGSFSHVEEIELFSSDDVRIWRATATVLNTTSATAADATCSEFGMDDATVAAFPRIGRSTTDDAPTYAFRMQGGQRYQFAPVLSLDAATSILVVQNVTAGAVALSISLRWIEGS